jgi:hypothetical protein
MRRVDAPDGYGTFEKFHFCVALKFWRLFRPGRMWDSMIRKIFFVLEGNCADQAVPDFPRLSLISLDFPVAL